MIKCYRKQYAVGQGGLHLGIITYPYFYNNEIVYNNYAYIYDCGCSSGNSIINRNIDDIISKLNNTKNLTYLYIFISHVHADHINGIKYLCEQLISNEIDLKIPFGHIVFVLPFMDETDKLISLGGIRFDDIQDYEETISFIINPRNIIDERFDIQYLTDIPPKNIDNYNNWDSYKIPLTDNNFLYHKNPFIFYSENRGYSWLVLPYYVKDKCKNKEVLIQELKKANINIANCTDKHLIKRLRIIYLMHCDNDLNLPSLCLYSGADKVLNYCYTGWIHTGDINFNKSNCAAYNGLINHYINLLNNVRVVQIPHHGSRDYSNISHFSVFKNLRSYFVTTQSVTNGGSKPHVSPEYLNNSRIILLNENSNFLWSYEHGNGIIWANF